MSERLLSEAELSELTGVPVATLVDWRYRRRGPSYVKLGARVRYRESDVDAWLAERTVHTSEMPAGPRRPARLRRVL